MRFEKAILSGVFAAMLVLAGCGGGGSSDGATNDSTNDHAPPAVSVRIQTALKTGNPLSLKPADSAQLLAMATKKAAQFRQQQMTALKAIYGTNPDLDLSVDIDHNSVSAAPRVSSVATPFIVSDNGNVLASISQRGKGRGLVYGNNLLSWMSGPSHDQQQHLPLFTRAMAWLLGQNPNQGLPAKVSFIASGYNGQVFKNYAARMGVEAKEINCDLGAADNTCWKQADLLLFGRSAPAGNDLTQRVKQYEKAGKAILLMPALWSTTGGETAVAHGLGIQLGGYPGNWFQHTAGTSVSAKRTIAASLERGDQFAGIHNSLQTIADPNTNFAFYTKHTNGAGDTETLLTSKAKKLLKSIDDMQQRMANLQQSGLDIFAANQPALTKELVLWADIQRRNIHYGSADLKRAKNVSKFLRAYASDSFLDFNREHTTYSPNGAGDYMPASARQIPVSQTPETIKVTVPRQGSGITLINRGAIPGKGVTIQVVDDGGVKSLGIQTSYVRTVGNPLGNGGYERPKHPQSYTIPLKKHGETHFVTPFGGPLMLNFSGAPTDQKDPISVTLRVTGAAHYAAFDFTPDGHMDTAKMQAAVAALNRRQFGWETIKMIGAEAQQNLVKLSPNLDNPRTLVQGALQEQLVGSNHTIMGYSDRPLAASGQTRCKQLSWDCTNDVIHHQPSVQHMVAWLPACGYLCSGQPIDSGASIGLGWGWPHEFGHNTVQRIFTIQTCKVECNNNVLPSGTMMRLYAITCPDGGKYGMPCREETPRLNYPKAYQLIVQNRQQGLTDDAQVDDMYQRLWKDAGQNTQRTLFSELAFVYTKVQLHMDKPDVAKTLEFLAMLNKGDRLVAHKGNGMSQEDKDRFGLGAFDKPNDVSNEDLLYGLSSSIIGRDMRKMFAMYGVKVSDKAHASVARLNLDMQKPVFYALHNGKRADEVTTGVWLDLSGGKTPAYPYAQ